MIQSLHNILVTVSWCCVSTGQCAGVWPARASARTPCSAVWWGWSTAVPDRKAPWQRQHDITGKWTDTVALCRQGGWQQNVRNFQMTGKRLFLPKLFCVQGHKLNTLDDFLRYILMPIFKKKWGFSHLKLKTFSVRGPPDPPSVLLDPS